VVSDPRAAGNAGTPALNKARRRPGDPDRDGATRSPEEAPAMTGTLAPGTVRTLDDATVHNLAAPAIRDPGSIAAQAAVLAALAAWLAAHTDLPAIGPRIRVQPWHLPADPVTVTAEPDTAPGQSALAAVADWADTLHTGLDVITGTGSAAHCETHVPIADGVELVVYTVQRWLPAVIR
jgi:hypothetical protein